MKARIIEIQFVNERFQVRHINEKNLSELLSDNGFARTEIVNPNKNTYSRFYVNNQNEYLLEFYFGGGILVKEKEELQKLSRVGFTQMQTWLFGDEITYSIGLTKEEYVLLSKDATAFSFGHQHAEDRIKSSFKLGNGCLLINWDNSPGAYMGYGLYEGVKTLYAGDPESIDLNSDQVELNRDRGTYQPTYKNNWTLFELEVVDGKHINADVGRTILSEVFTIDFERLDYSKESLELLDRSIFANWNRVDSDDVFLAFVSYIGELVRRDHNLEWMKSAGNEDWPYSLQRKNGEKINLDWIIYRRMFDCGLMLEASGAHHGVEVELR